jgi:hypothetical protein
MADGNNASPRKGGRKRPTAKTETAAQKVKPKGRRRLTAAKTKAARKVEKGGSTRATATAKRVKRDREMYVAWRLGVDCETLAERHDLTARRVRQICDELRAASFEAFEVTNPIAALANIDRALVRADAAVSSAALILEGAMKDKNWSVAIGAARRGAEARKELLNLQQLRGIVPHNLAQLQDLWDGMQLAAEMIGVLNRHDVPREVMDEIAGVVNLGTRDDRGRVELDERAGEVVDAEVAA